MTQYTFISFLIPFNFIQCVFAVSFANFLFSKSLNKQRTTPSKGFMEIFY